ncbi:hypothetical protein MNBD_NITROSPIRAE01-1818 [hydrothermal vent metagenome]|uniref:Uncharacterized protein n=1 Tax=hydrothermal vent metagenome TaxID=652676 RepID=A0A3B1CU91_9ZZZZ
MKQQWVVFFTLIVLTALTGCAGLTAMLTTHGRLTSEAEEAYTRGDLDSTVRKTVKALTIEPEYEKAQRLLVSVFEPAVLEHTEEIAALKGSTKLEDLSRVITKYEILIQLNRLVKNLPPLLDKNMNLPIRFVINDFSSDWLLSKKVAAGAYYAAGTQLGLEGGIIKNRAASEHFKKVMIYVPGYKDTDTLAKKYQKLGTKRVAIIPFLWPEDQNQYKALGRKIVDDLKQSITVQNKKEMEYLHIVPSETVNDILSKHQLGQHGLEINKESAIEIGKALSAHELIVGDITMLSITPPTTNEQEKRETTTVTITRQKNLKERGMGVLGDVLGGKSAKKSVGKHGNDTNTVQEDVEVFADITVYELNAAVKVSGVYNVINLQTVNNRESDIISGESAFSHRWASFSGDKRALSKHTKKLLEQNANRKAPAESKMVNNAVNDFSQSLLSKLKAELFNIEGYK